MQCLVFFDPLLTGHGVWVVLVELEFIRPHYEFFRVVAELHLVEVNWLRLQPAQLVVVPRLRNFSQLLRQLEPEWFLQLAGPVLDQHLDLVHLTSLGQIVLLNIVLKHDHSLQLLLRFTFGRLFFSEFGHGWIDLVPNRMPISPHTLHGRKKPVLGTALGFNFFHLLHKGLAWCDALEFWLITLLHQFLVGSVLFQFKKIVFD